MRIISVNVSLPRTVSYMGKDLATGIFKKPISGPIMLRHLNLDGDRQADLTVHGGPSKAAYAYPSEHYPFWANQFPGRALPWGSFGENFTTEGMLETEVNIGDRYRIGSATVMVGTPRVPCFKLSAKFQSEDMGAQFLHSGRSGFYFSVVEEGEVGAGDEFQFLGAESPTLTVLETFTLFWTPTPDLDLLKRAITIKALPEGWRERFRLKLTPAER